MEFEKSIPFKNWTADSFTGRFGGIDYKFEPGGTYNVPASQAAHFAKQLAVQELHTRGYAGNRVRGEMLSDQDVMEYSNKCYPSIKPGEVASTVGSFERVEEPNEDADEGEEETPKPKAAKKGKTKDAEYQ